MNRLLTPLAIFTLSPPAWADSPPAWADVLMDFQEDAPTDRFTIRGLGECSAGAADVVIDLSGSDAGLIFDVTETEAGVAVFQRFNVVAGAEALTALPKVADGDTAVTLPLRDIALGTAVSFTIDVDDTAGTRAITISGSEISGASVRVETGAAQFEGRFGLIP